MSFELIKNVSMLNFDFGSVLLNVLGIIGLIVVGAFVITFIADWIIYLIDDKNGIFFKRKDADTQEKLPDRPKMLEQPAPENAKEEDLEPTVDEQIAQLSQNNKVDFDKALQEEEELKAKLALNKDGVITEENVEDDDFDIEEAINQLKQQEYQEEKVKELEERNEVIEQLEQEDAEKVEEFDADDDMDDDDFDAELRKIIEALNNNESDSAEGIITEIKEPIEEESEEVSEEIEQIAQEQVEEFIQQEVVEEKEEQSNFAKERSALEEEIARLKQELEEEKEKLRQERIDAMAKAANLESEKEQLLAELEEAKKDNSIVNYAPLMTEEEYEARLEMLHERLKENERQIRINKKEFKPLERVKNTLERDKQKLRRREAIVAKQKVVLYGVNNFVDIDEEKAQKLSEDLDLLDGLRMSVQHCEEVMEANKDRYPILEQTYNILQENNAHIKADIAQTEEELARLREVNENNVEEE